MAGTEFAFEDANTKTAYQRIWNDPDLSWSVGDTIEVKLLEPTSPVMSIYPPSTHSEGSSRQLIFELSWDPGTDRGRDGEGGGERDGEHVAHKPAHHVPQCRVSTLGQRFGFGSSTTTWRKPDSLVTVRVLPGEGYRVGVWTSEARGTVKVTDDDQSLESESDTVRAVLYPRSALDPDKTSQYLLVDWRGAVRR